MSDPTGRPAPRLVTLPFVVVTAAASFYFIAIGMTLPTLPRMVVDDLGGGGLAVGISAGAMAVTAAALRPWVGRTGDTRGRRPLVIGGATLGALALVGHVLVTSVPQLVLMRLLVGAAEAMFFVGAATAAQDLAPDTRRAEAASYFSVAIWGGTGVGPWIAETLRTAHSIDVVWWVAAASCAVAAALGTRMPRTLPRPATGERRLFHPAALTPGWVLVLAVTGLAAFQTFITLFADQLGMADAAGIFLLYSAIILGTRVIGASIPDRLGPRRVAGAGLVLSAIGLGAVAVATTPTVLYVGVAVMALGFGPIYPALLSMVLSVTPEGERSAAISTFSLFFDLAQGVGLPLVGAVVALQGERSAFVVGTICQIAALVVLRTRTSSAPPLPSAPR